MGRGADAESKKRLRNIAYQTVQAIRGERRNCWATYGAIFHRPDKQDYGNGASSDIYDVLQDANKLGTARLLVGRENNTIRLRSQASMRTYWERAHRRTRWAIRNRIGKRTAALKRP